MGLPAWQFTLAVEIAATALRVLAHDESAPPPGPRPQLETGWGHRPS
jgi:hypothetical protein